MRPVKPKYIQLMEQLRNWATSGQIQPGGRFPSEHELAEQFGMSRQTVRQAIAELEHEGWLFREQGRGTFLSSAPNASHASMQPSRIIGVVTTYISDYIFPSIIRGIESRLAPEGYSILLLSTHNDFKQEAQALRTVLTQNVDGVIIEPTKSAYPNPNLDFYFELIEHRVPFVMLHSSYVELNALSLRVDDTQGERLAVEHLIAGGHRRIGGIFKSDDLQGKYRLKGLIDALQEHGLSVVPQLIRQYATHQRTDIAEQYVRFILDKLTKAFRPTAIACYNDEIAMQVVKHLRLGGISVPDEISVVGFDDSQYAEASDIGLTTIKHPKFDMGVAAADAILAAMGELTNDTHHGPHDHVFEPELIIRSSTGPLPHA